MASLFRPKHNTLARLSLLLIAGGAAGSIGGALVYVRSPLARGTEDPIEQPIQFDHRHHTRDEGIDCRFCHTTVESSPHAGLPDSELCMKCHSQIWNSSPMLEPVRRSFIENKPIVWRKVNDVPDFVYFNHAIHVKKGVGCVTCHGQVDQMAAVEKAKPMTMSWCLECHRNPGQFLRPPEEVTNMEWKPAAPAHHGEGEDAAVATVDYVEANQVHTRTSCTTCHR